jgi:pentose-5-phosphate-3-epimerase
VPRLNLETLAGILKNGDAVIAAVRGGNTPQTIQRLKEIAADPVLAAKLLTHLDNLEQNLRSLRYAELDLTA